jgi:uncharacterized membrane protein YvbJ
MASDTIWAIILIFVLIVIYWFTFPGVKKALDKFVRSKQRQQTGGKDKKMRICPKCGMQNDGTSKFCSDCAYEFKKQNDMP